MRYYSLFLILVLTILIGVQPPALHATSPTIVINELMWMGSSASSADEWIELRNTTDQEIDLSGWTLSRLSNGQTVSMVTVPAGKHIPAQGYFVISNYPVGDKSVLSIVPDLVTSDVALANTNLQITLRDAGQQMIDTAGNGGTEPAAGRNQSSQSIYWSMERHAEPGDGQTSSNWHSATSTANLILNAVERATPGAANSNGAPSLSVLTEHEATVQQPVLLDASDTVDPENDPLAFRWTIGAEQFSGPQVSYLPHAVGDVSGVLMVDDGHTQQQVTIVIHVRDASATPASVVASTAPCTHLQLVELLPNPKGADTTEFLVLKNTDASDQSLAGCRLQINSTRQYQLTGTIAAKSELVLTKQRFRLPNTAAMIELLDAQGAVLDRVQYPKAKEGRSWSRLGNDWGWAAATPKSANAPFDPIESSVLGASTTTTSTPRITVRGQVVAQTGIVGTRYAVIQAADGVWLARTAEPFELTLGAKVVLIGKQSTYQGHRSIVVEGKPTIQSGVVAPGVAAVLGDLDEERAFHVVIIRGTVQTVRGSSFDVEDESGQGTVTLKSTTHIIRPILRAGDHVTVTGIVQASTTGLRIMPRTKSDLVITERIASEAKPDVQIVPTSSAQTTWYWMAGAVGLALVVGWKWWQQRRGSSTT